MNKHDILSLRCITDSVKQVKFGNANGNFNSTIMTYLKYLKPVGHVHSVLKVGAVDSHSPALQDSFPILLTLGVPSHNSHRLSYCDTGSKSRAH